MVDDYMCICALKYFHGDDHHYMCKMFNLRRELEKRNNTGIAKHWREVEEIERLENEISRIKNSTRNA